MAIVAKMRAAKVEQIGGMTPREVGPDDPAYASAGQSVTGDVRRRFVYDQPGQSQESVELRAVSDAANAEWSTATPAGELRLTINNPCAFGAIKPGRDYYVEVREARK